MSDPVPDQSESSEGNAEAVPVSPWLRATIADLQDLDFEASIAGSKSADAGELSDLFRPSIQSGDKNTEPPDTAATRIAILLSSVTGMHFKPDESNEPFGAMIVFADGRRSAIPSDFRAGHVDLLADLANRARHPVLRTRLADVCWLLDRKRANFGTMALAGYGEIVTKADKGELLFRFEKEGGALQHDAHDYLRRALQLGRMLGWEKPECITARGIVTMLRKRAAESRALVPLLWFAELDLDFRVSDAKEVGLDIDQVVANLPDGAHSHIVIELWRLGARARTHQQNSRRAGYHHCALWSETTSRDTFLAPRGRQVRKQAKMHRLSFLSHLEAVGFLKVHARRFESFGTIVR
jgi:hypothetical protein